MHILYSVIIISHDALLGQFPFKLFTQNNGLSCVSVQRSCGASESKRVCLVKEAFTNNTHQQAHAWLRFKRTVKEGGEGRKQQLTN